jgi:hypothetical protein
MQESSSISLLVNSARVGVAGSGIGEVHKRGEVFVICSGP